MQKFIITLDGELRFGDVRLHRDLLPWGDEECHGGGFWTLNAEGTGIDLYGRSFDFGPADFGQLRCIDWSGAGGKPMAMFFFPDYPDRVSVLPVYVK